MYLIFGFFDELWNWFIFEVDLMLLFFCDMGLMIVVVFNFDGFVVSSLEWFGLCYYFEYVIDFYFVGYVKFDLRIFVLVLVVGNVDVVKIMYVGDMYVVDIIGSWVVGFYGLLFYLFNDYKDVDCDLIMCLLEILEWIVIYCLGWFWVDGIKCKFLCGFDVFVCK